MRWYDRLRRRAEIAFVRRRGRVASTPTVTAYLVEPVGARSRFGVTVSTRVGKAVVRNLVRRRIRGALAQLPVPAKPLRVLFVAKPAAAEAAYARLADDVARVLGAKP